jgi:hypothetical protein
MVVNLVDGDKQIVGLEPSMMTNDLSLAHPIDSIKELYNRAFGDSPTPPADAPAAPVEKPAEAPKPEAKPEEKPEDVLKKIQDDPEAKSQREHLDKVADEKIKNPEERKKFKEDMEALEKRGSEQKPPLSPEDIAKTYKEISKLMETKDSPDVPIKEADRVKLAEQVMRQAAHPQDISQGGYNTCNVTTVEVRTYTKNPAEAARMVADVATTGKYESNGKPPVVVQPDKESLKRHGESKQDSGADNTRTYASQVFQVTAVNIEYSQRRAKGGDDIRYEQHEPKPAGPHNKPPADMGERLYNYSKEDPITHKPPLEVMDNDNPKVPARNPSLGDHQIAQIDRQINGERKDGSLDGPVVISREPQKNNDTILEARNKLLALDLKTAGVGDGSPIDLTNPEAVKKTRDAIDQRENDGLDHDKAQKLRDDLDLAAKEKNKELRNDNGVVIIHSEKEMEETLAKMKAEGRLPAIIAVSASREPFKTDSGGHQTGDIGGGHVVTVTDYHPAEKDAQGNITKPATVDMDNQWGKSSDHSGDKAMTVKELYEAQEAPKGPTIAKLEDLEKKYNAGEFNGKEADYDKQLQQLYLEEMKEFDKNKGTPQEQQERLAVETLKDSLRQLQPSPQRGQKILAAAIADYKKQHP